MAQYQSGRLYVVAWGTSKSGKRYPKLKSLKTDKISIVKLRMGGKLAEIRNPVAPETPENLSLGECAEKYLQNIRSLPRRGKMRQPRSIKYREETVALIRRAWPKFNRTAPSAVTPQTCNEVMANVLHILDTRIGRNTQKSFATRYNWTLQSLRGILEVAVDMDVISQNPAHKLEQLSVQKKERHPPFRELLGKIFSRLGASGRMKFAAKLVRALAFTGLRANEVRHLTAVNCVR